MTTRFLRYFLVLHIAWLPWVGMYAQTSPENSSQQEVFDGYQEEDFDLDELEKECKGLPDYTVWQKASFMYEFLKAKSLETGKHFYTVITRNIAALAHFLSSPMDDASHDKR